MPKPVSLAEHLAAARIRVRRSLAEQTAAQMGPPANAVSLSRRQQIERWWYRDPKVDPLRLAGEGRTAGEIAMALYPYRLDLMKAQGESKRTWVRYAEQMNRTAPPAPTEDAPPAEPEEAAS